MPNPIDLNKLSFGALAAERDLAGLESYFLESESFLRFRDGHKFVALGNRGSGKTAIFKMVAAHHRSKGSLVIELAPEDYSYELLNKTMAREDEGAWAKHGAYASAWKYLLYVSAMKAAVGPKGLKTGKAKRIYEYVRDKHATFEKNPIGALISYLKRLEGIKIGKYEAAVKVKELEKLYRLEEINDLLDDLNTICEKRKIVMLVDELDRGWDASEDAKSFVAGLFQAAVSMNSRTPNIRTLVSLRRELYESIPALYEDAQKVRDVIEVIEWDEPQLFKLIARRIGTSLGQEMEEEHALWEKVFAETLEYRKNKSFNYIVDRTLYRPRELIQFCTEARSVALSAKEEPPLNYGVISEAEQRYSQDRLKDIGAEYRFQYPGLESVFETFRGLCYNFTREELETHCLKLIFEEFVVSEEAKKWTQALEPQSIIEALWKVGFLRAQAVGGIKARRRSGSQYLGPHQIASLNLADLSRFHVHPMFRAHLGMKEPKGD